MKSLLNTFLFLAMLAITSAFVMSFVPYKLAELYGMVGVESKI